MNDMLMQVFQRVFATDSAVLPELWVTQMGMRLGWSLLLAWLGAWLGAWAAQRFAQVKEEPAGVSRRAGDTEQSAASPRLQGRFQIATAVLLAAWAWVPGPYSPTYWLGLALQAPSLTSMFLCAIGLYQRLRPQPVATVTMAGHQARYQVQRQAERWLLVLGVALGWVLLLDTFALLPVSVYAWGFSPVATGMVLVLALLPGACGGGSWKASPLMGAPALAVLVFVVTRLTTGNVLDAVLDPLLWAVLHLLLWRHVRQRNPV